MYDEYNADDYETAQGSLDDWRDFPVMDGDECVGWVPADYAQSEDRWNY